MNEFPFWMNPAHVADAQAAVAQLPEHLQEVIRALGADVITALHEELSADELFLQLRESHPDAVDALEALEEISVE